MDILFKKLIAARLKKDFFKQETEVVARALLGKLLVFYDGYHLLVGMIVETESYRSDDPASHAYRGKTERNSAMFGPVGKAYVYINYGLHYGFNVVARSQDFEAGGVLIRAVEPLEGIEIMKKNRNTKTADSLKELTNGPGKLTEAFGITKEYNHHDLLTSSEIFLSENILYPEKEHPIEVSERIGISKAQERPWRFFIKNNPFVSKYTNHIKLS